MFLKKLLISFTICIWAFSLHAQISVIDPQSIIADIMEEIIANSEDDVDLDALMDELVFFAENPININSTTQEELGRLIFLSDFQIIALLDYVKNYGAMFSVYELQLVVGFDYNDINRLTPFIKTEAETKQDQRIPLFKWGKHDLFLRARSLVEDQIGYTSAPASNPEASRYKGNKLGLYTRYSYRTKGGLQMGFVGEKDPGEEFFKGSNPYGFDHYSFHLQIDEIGKVKRLVVGDFNATFGQGLTMWTSTSFGKSPDPMGVRKRANGLTRFSSTNENEFLRGAGATIQVGRFDVSVFGSYKHIDANLTDSLIDGLSLFTTRPISGLHRTSTEINNKKTLAEFVTGSNISIALKKLNLGATASFVNLHGVYDPPNQPYRYFEPQLKDRVNIGIDFSYGLGNHLFFGEAATTVNHGSGIVSGGLFRLHPQLTLSILGRHYQKDYSTYYTNALADGSGPANESGILTGFNLLLYKNWQLSGYVDVFQSSWLRYGVNAPSRGHDYLLEASYSPRSRLNVKLRYRFKQKNKNQTVDEEPNSWVIPYDQQALRFHLAYNPTRTIYLKTRIEFSWYNEENLPQESGIMLYQDISYQPQNIPLSITGRFAIFETDSWNTRIYAYENDILYYFSIPAYYSRGTRAYLLAKYSIKSNIDIWFRVAQTYFADQKELGSGLDKIDGPTRSDVRIQLRYKF